MASLTEENYLKLIYRLSGSGSQEVSTNALAEQTGTRAASVTDMLRKLSEKQLIHYQRYKGVTLTPQGRLLALQVVRRHRLWEVFLVEKLGFGWDEVHPLAEELEHIASEELVRRLDAFLGSPQADPHGDPIPRADGSLPPAPTQWPLSGWATGRPARVAGVLEDAPALLQFLARTGLTPGSVVVVEERNDFDGSLLVSVGEQPGCFLSYRVAAHVLVDASV